MQCAGCRRPVTKDDHLIAVIAGRLPAGLSPWCQSCFWTRSFGGRARWFAAFDQPCTCHVVARDWVSGPCHRWAHDNLAVLVQAIRSAPRSVSDDRPSPRLPVFRTYNALGRCLVWSG